MHREVDMEHHRIVIVDDDPVMPKVMRVLFEDEGYSTVTVPRASQSFAEIIGQPTDIIILDVNLPDMNGFALCYELRARRYQGPIIFLTGRNHLTDKLEGYDLGADDYIVKPYEPLELVARVHCVLRRFYMTDQQSLGLLLRVDDAELSVVDLSYSSAVVIHATLTPTEMRILECLMRNAGTIIDRETLIERVWGVDFDGDTNRVDVYMRRLRRKIEADPTDPRYLHTVRGIGYVFQPEMNYPPETFRVDVQLAAPERVDPTS
jgi:DNA-binding response OmpR family regulator